MDYEKKYNEALNWMRELYPGLHGATKEDAEHYFPELRESEDERIRKYLVEELKAAKSVGELKFTIPQPTREECIAYLEKQKEHHIPWYDYQKSKEAGYTIVPNGEYEQLIKQKEQNPAWSEEDEKMRNLAIEWAETMYGQFRFVDMGSTDFRKIVAWLKSLRPQPKQEWSEEDESELTAVIYCVSRAIKASKDENERNSLLSAKKWLQDKLSFRVKSLRPSWKPSEEQMEGLKFFLEFHRSQRNAGTVNWREYDAIESLYEQLKKL